MVVLAVIAMFTEMHMPWLCLPDALVPPPTAQAPSRPRHHRFHRGREMEV